LACWSWPRKNETLPVCSRDATINRLIVDSVDHGVRQQYPACPSLTLTLGRRGPILLPLLHSHLHQSETAPSENALSIKAPRSIRNSSVNRHAVGSQIRNRTRCFHMRARGSYLAQENRGKIFPRTRTEMVRFPHAHPIDASH